MGYTHYWKSLTDVDTSRFEELSESIDKMLGKQDVELDFDGRNENEIFFNGVGEHGHETFNLTKGSTWDFCKTARKPYDKVVVACLVLAEYFLPGFSWSSDGGPSDHVEGRLMAEDWLETSAHLDFITYLKQRNTKLCLDIANIDEIVQKNWRNEEFRDIEEIVNS